MASARATPRAVAPLHGSIVTAAVDFGTACSGYAFTFRHEPMKIYTNAWRSEGGAVTTAKAPTIVLFDPDGNFHTFGFEAQQFYTDMIEEEEGSGEEYKRWYYFQNFKMELYRQQSLTMETELEDTGGKKMPAMKIFSASIGYLKQMLMKDIRRSYNKAQDDDVLWILTVPALWSEPAKQFMRVAANEAGIDNCRLRLVLEPEAASIYCQTHCTLRDIQAGGDVKLEPFPDDHTYIVADLGGGTADIATHQVVHGGRLRELFRATGGDLGALKVNRKFKLLLIQIFGKDTMADFRQRFRAGYSELMREFDFQKKMVNSELKKPLKLRCPTALAECVQKFKEKSLKEFLLEEHADLVSYKSDKLHISPRMVDLLFKEVSENIADKIKNILQQQNVQIKSLLLVGGFADSLYLQEKIEKEVKEVAPEINIIKPEEAGLHVLKGAALSTILPTSICERISPFAYGLRAAVPFDEEKHPADYREVRESGIFCSDIFERFIEKGQILRVGDTLKHRKEKSLRNPASKMEDRSMELYRSVEPDPQYTFENGCERVAKIVLEHPTDGWPDYIVFDIEVTVGETELLIDVVNGTTGQILSAKVDFLGN